jgi:hypothetical protein
MPKNRSGINRSDKSGLIDRKNYETGIEYEVTKLYDVKFISDEKGSYRDEAGNRFRREEIMPESKGFLAIKKSPEGTRIKVHVQEYYSGSKHLIPEHDEYYEIRSFPTRKNTLDLDFIGNYPKEIYHSGTSGTIMHTAKDVQRHLRFATKITIYKPKGSK